MTSTLRAQLVAVLALLVALVTALSTVHHGLAVDEAVRAVALSYALTAAALSVLLKAPPWQVVARSLAYVGAVAAFSGMVLVASSFSTRPIGQGVSA